MASKLNDYKVSKYEHIGLVENTEISLHDYVTFVKAGSNKAAVDAGRAVKHDKEAYTKVKANSMAIMGTGTVPSGKTKHLENLVPIGIVVMDIDTDLTDDNIHALYNDPYSFISHRSFGGDGVCIFVRINPDKLPDAYLAVSKYYKDKYDINVDMACRNPNRLRFMSYDPELVVNEKAKQFNVKIEKKDLAPKRTDFVFTQSDFDHILSQIKDRRIDLCNEDYYAYVRIGMSLASHFGESGRDNFHFICSQGLKYNQKRADRDYSGFVSSVTKMSIGTFYWYCKNAGIEIYTEKTRTIINRVKVGKSQGSPTVESICDVLKEANSIEATEEDKVLIAELIHSNVDYSGNANSDFSDIKQLTAFIVDAYSPSYNLLSHSRCLKGVEMTDESLNDVYLACVDNFKFKVTMTDVMAIIKSSNADKIDPLTDFFQQANDYNPVGFIDSVADCIEPQSEYNRWAFKKWIVGGVHNWTRDDYDMDSCALTMVLTGGPGTGKTTFFKNLLPKELIPYMYSGKLSALNDVVFRLASRLLFLDDEFGGKAFKDVTVFKDLSQQSIITQRRPYEKMDKDYIRRALLCGTSNEKDIDGDPTGNRRILPFNITGINVDKFKQIDKTALWIEAYNLLKDGFDWRIWTKEDIEYLRDNTSVNKAVNPLDEVFDKYFKLEETEDNYVSVVLNQSEIWEFLTFNTPFKIQKNEMKDVYRKLNMEYTTQRCKLFRKVKKGFLLFVDSEFDLSSPIINKNTFQK